MYSACRIRSLMYLQLKSLHVSSKGGGNVSVGGRSAGKSVRSFYLQTHVQVNTAAATLAQTPTNTKKYHIPCSQQGALMSKCCLGYYGKTHMEFLCHILHLGFMI